MLSVTTFVGQQSSPEVRQGFCPVVIKRPEGVGAITSANLQYTGADFRRTVLREQFREQASIEPMRCYLAPTSGR